MGSPQLPPPPPKKRVSLHGVTKLQLTNGRFKIWIDIIVKTLVNPVLFIRILIILNNNLISNNNVITLSTLPFSQCEYHITYIEVIFSKT